MERRERWSTFLNIPNEKFEANLVGGELISGNRVVFSALPNWMPHSHFLQASRFSSQFNFHKIDEAEFEKIKSKKWLRKDRNSKRQEAIRPRRKDSAETLPLPSFLPSILQTADWILAAKLETVQREERKRSRKRTYEKRIIAGKKQGRGRKRGELYELKLKLKHTHHIGAWNMAIVAMESIDRLIVNAWIQETWTGRWIEYCRVELMDMEMNKLTHTIGRQTQYKARRSRAEQSRAEGEAKKAIANRNPDGMESNGKVRGMKK